MRRCAVYARVSTDMQGESLDNQVDYAREYIRRLGADYHLEEDCVYSDSDQSGYYTRFLQRPAIQRAMQEAKAQRFDVIVFKEISRISRDQAEHVEIVSRFTQYGIRVIAINDNLDSNRPETLDLLGIHSVMSEMESKRISSRVSSGKKSLARRGFWTGEAPIGYAVNPETKRLIIDDSFASIPKLIFQLFTKERYGTFRIAEYLNDRGLLTKNGRFWSRVTVNRVLKNPAYRGDMVYGRTRNTLKRVFDDNGYTKIQSRQQLPEEDWVVIQDAHPAIVDVETFSLAQSIMAGRSRQNPRRAKHPLTGILKCGKCGAGMVCQVQRNKGATYRYYSCSRAFRFGRSSCSQPNVNADKLEEGLRTHLIEELRCYAQTQVFVTPKKYESDTQNRMRQLNRHLAKTLLGLERLLADPEIPTHTMNRVKRSYIDAIQKFELEQQELRRQFSTHEEHRARTMKIQDYLEYLMHLDWTDLTVSRRFFHTLIQEIVINDLTVTDIELKYSSHKIQLLSQ
ncbi:recombinase family protein [Alicyclobacillus sp. SO9]|uniref:recombinase family protein n=1 Tax=Alicyclobacillus sp. SO9 TaxID=2665646 RepID=UPI0018E8ACA1|nr:recombinase family protein [Alicyclobacillus sp. SO9]QQE79624.1 recombinase family protein [Alicyclobacillus sp. SO9]